MYDNTTDDQRLRVKYRYSLHCARTCSTQNVPLTRRYFRCVKPTDVFGITNFRACACVKNFV